MGMTVSLAVATALVALASLTLSPRARTAASFYKGHSPAGVAPDMWSLALSQVTTWIFARSIMNATILGYFYGIGGALAYAAYYLSFLTGAWIIDALRFRHGFPSVQAFLHARFGSAGTGCYNFVVGLRLLSEVFANLLVIGLIFGAEGSQAYILAIGLVGAVTLAYSMIGGLHASIRTDVVQMWLFLVVLAALMAIALATGRFDIGAILASTPTVENPGWVLFAVALIQVVSYPMHDPVMMDRGFIADRRTTLASFYHAAWLSIVCILAFGLLGVWAGLHKAAGESFVPTFARLLGDIPVFLFNVALIVSCMSTLDSTFASAAKLAVVDMRLAQPSVANGRIAMLLFLLGGLGMVFVGSNDLFAAVAVSGTASLYLAPVVIFSLWLGRSDVPVWSYLLSFLAAMTAAILYFFYDNADYARLLGPLLGFEQKYSKLLVLCIAALVVGSSAFLVGMATSGRRQPNVTPSTA
ncbi:MAG TPA: hypothetical protein VNK52_08445 [Hyphomicrobiaceae bacterium]|nr:hypothetical protein [Hyphomicrobiaceae bacterium]